MPGGARADRVELLLLLLGAGWERLDECVLVRSGGRTPSSDSSSSSRCTWSSYRLLLLLFRSFFLDPELRLLPERRVGFSAGGGVSGRCGSYSGAALPAPGRQSLAYHGRCLEGWVKAAGD